MFQVGTQLYLLLDGCLDATGLFGCGSRSCGEMIEKEQAGTDSNKDRGPGRGLQNGVIDRSL